MKKVLLAACAAIALGACSTSDKNVLDVTKQAVSAEAPDGVLQAVPMPSAPLDENKTLTRIVFASCAHQNEDQSIWDVVAAENQDLTLYIGDNVYGDVRSGDRALPELKTAYMRLAQSAPFARARAAAPMITAWDDHDYGLNDAGAEFEHKQSAEALYEYVWAIDDERASYPGTYGSWIVGGEDGKRVHVIVLDTRFFRSELKPTDEFGAPGKERYLPDDNPDKTMLGEAQWDWLEEELKKPADLRLLVSSVQVISEGHGWEAWKMLPTERDRLYSLIDDTDAKGLIILSGDRHSAAFYQKEGVNAYPLFEATSSSLNLPLRGFLREGQEFEQEPGPNRLTDMIIDPNYGVIDIDWDAGDVVISIRDDTGGVIEERSVALSSLK